MKEVSWSSPEFKSIVRTLGARTGLAFRPHQRESTEKGIQSAMARSGIEDLSEFLGLVEHDDKALEHLICELTVGETYFLREPNRFDFIREHILPEIVSRSEQLHKIRIWSAACASGEEPYSLAILCAEDGLASRCSILGTDVSVEALDKARAAAYRPWSLRGRGEAFAKPHGNIDGEFFQLGDAIRRLVHFEFLNLAMDVYPSLVTGTQAMDLILCRNVLIYFNSDTIRAVAERLYRCLTDGGWLITAAGDPPLEDFAPFEVIMTDSGTVYRKPLSRVAADTSDVAPTNQRIGPPRQPDSRAVNGTKLFGERRTHSNLSQPDNTISSSQLVSDSKPDPVLEAGRALAAGEYEMAAELTSACLANTKACVIHVNALANIDAGQALDRCRQLAESHPLSAELHYLHAVLALESKSEVNAIQAAERAVYVDRTLAMAHFLIGSIRQRHGDFDASRRAFQNAANLCRAVGPNDVLPLSEGETAQHLLEAVNMHLAAIDAALRK